jgi:hypothetical protein
MSDTNTGDLTDRIELIDRGNGVELDIEGCSDDFNISIDFHDGDPKLLVEKPATGNPPTPETIQSAGQFYIAHAEPGWTEVAALRLGESTLGGK